MAADFRESCISYIHGDDFVECTLQRGPWQTKVRKPKERYPDQVEIPVENKDGSIIAKFPLKWVRINPGLEMTEERKAAMAERARENFGFPKNQESHPQI